MYNRVCKQFILAAALNCFTLPAAMAQNLFNFGATQNTSSQSQSGAPPQVMSPDQFKNTVNTKSQQAKDAVNQQLKQDYNKQPPLPPSNNVMAPAAASPNTTPVPMQNSTSPVPPVPVTPVAPPQTAAPSNTYAPSAGPAPNTGPTTVYPQSAPSQPLSTPQPQPYTGFGTGNTNTNTNTNTRSNTNSAPSNSGGWNIKY